MAAWLTKVEAEGMLGTVSAGARVALGGGASMAPVGLIKALLAGQARDLHLITAPTGGFGVELVIASGRAAVVETAQVSLGELGMAPAFRQEVEGGRLKVFDAS